MRRSVLRPGFNVSTSNPEDVLETRALRDVARLRAAKLSRNREGRLFVWDWNPENGLRRVIASAEKGVVRWHRACRRCDERGCDDCEYLGSIVDHTGPAERWCDSI